MNDGTNDSSRYYCRCRDGRGNGDRVITTAIVVPSPIVAPTVVIVIDVDIHIAIDVHIVVDVYVSVDIVVVVYVRLRAATKVATTATLGQEGRS